MIQQEKAQEILERLFMQVHYARVGVSESFLRNYACKKWVSENEPLQADALIDEAEKRVSTGSLKKFNKGATTYYKLP